MTNTWESDSGNISDTPATTTTNENKYVQFVVPSFSLLTQGYPSGAAVPNASDVPGNTPTYGNSFLRMGSFPVATTPSASDPSSFATSFALANSLVATVESDQWDSSNVSDDQSMLTQGGVWDHTDGNRVVTTLGDKIEVVNGNYVLQVNGSDMVPVTSSTAAPMTSTLVGLPGQPIGAGASPPAATLPIAGDMPNTKQLQAGDVFTGTWANRILSYTGSQGNNVPLVYSVTYAGTVASVTTASAVLSTTAAADVTNELVCLTQQSAEQIGVDATLYIAGASVELDIIPGIQATEALIGIGQVSDTNIAGFSLSNATVGGAITSNQIAGGLILSTQVAAGMITTSAAAGAGINNVAITVAGVITSTTEATFGGLVSTQVAGIGIESSSIAGGAIISTTTAGAAITNTTTAAGVITNTNTAPNTINNMVGVSTDIHAGVHIDNHPMAHVDVHTGSHIELGAGMISEEEGDKLNAIVGMQFSMAGDTWGLSYGDDITAGATIQML